MKKAVFDTNILLQAVLSDKGPAHASVELVLQGEITLVLSAALISEVFGVISRPSLIRKYPELASPDTSDFLDRIFTTAECRPQPRRAFVLERDPADEVFINLAIEADANFLVTRDNDLLDLRKDSAFSSAFPRLNIVTPVGFLEIVRAA